MSGAELILTAGGHPSPPAVVLDYKGHLCNLRDSLGGVVWTPALPGCPADVRADWLSIIAAHGGTHVPIGSFTPGEAYPGIGYVNPDWTHDPAAIRGLLLEILNRGMVPVVFLDSGGPHPIPRLDSFYPVMAEAGAGLWDRLLTVPCGWEPVVGDWTSYEVSYGLQHWKAQVPEAIIGYHGSPARLVGSSNPVQADDPWQGGEAIFYTSHGGEFIDIALYQTPHGHDLYAPDTCPNAAEKFGHEDACILNRWEDYVARIGTGYHGWRQLPIVGFETVAYEYFRGWATSEQAREVASKLKTVTDKWGIDSLWGNGEPL